ncbi:alpha/beta hydrolase [Nocardia sp. NPDC051030]|uniref:alpha/beta hydrolase n=1 Tax=Nocardia sp. NPDC051030 TaxID=3155162 RepID=UPI003444F912
MIWRPPGADYYGWLVGMQWPQGNEDLMWSLADDWKAASAGLNSIQGDIDAAMAAVRLAYPEGDGGDAMLSQLKLLKYGGDGGAGSIDSLVKWFDSIAGLAENTGTEFEYTKLMFHAMLLIMAVDMAIAAATLIGAPAAEAAVIAANRVTTRVLIKQLLKKLAQQGLKFTEIAELKAVIKELSIRAGKFVAMSAGLGAVLGAAPDAAIQLWQVEHGRRKEFNWEQVGTMAAAGAAGGLVAGGVGARLHGLFGTPASTLARVTTTGITALAAGGSAGLAGWATSGLITNHWELDPRMITAGMWGGAAPGAVRAVRPTVSAPHVPEATASLKSEPAPSNPGTHNVGADSHQNQSVVPDHSTTDSSKLTGNATHLGDSTVGKQNPEVSPAAARVTDPVGSQHVPTDPVVHNEIAGSPVAGTQQAAAAPSAHQAPSVADPKVSGNVQSAGPAHISGEPRTPVDGRPAPTVTPRADTHGSATSADSTRAGAAPSREAAGPAAQVQAKTTGAEVTSRAGERVEAAQTERAGVPAADRPDTRIGGRNEDPTSGRESTPDGPSDRTPARDEQQPHRDESGRTRDEDASGNGRSPERDGSDPAHNGQTPHDAQPPHGSDSAAPSEHAPRSVLPEDHSITEAERNHALNALNKLGDEIEARHLLHVDDIDQAGAHAKAAENHAWWQSLTGDEQAAMVRTHPHEVGNADGVPPHVRDQANRLSITRDLAELRERNPRVDKWTSRFTDPEGRQQFKNLESTVRNLQHAEDLADAFARRNQADLDGPAGHRPPVHVLSYDSTAFNGEGRAVVAFGDVGKASTVSWHVPGITTTVRSLEVNLNNAFNHYSLTSDNVRDPAAVASIAWIGYDAPSGSRITKEMTNPALAQRGGQLLARDVAGFNQTRKLNAALPDGAPSPDVHLFGHSYGSTTTSFAGAGGRLSGEVSTITLLGSPGAGPVLHASEFGIGGDNVFVASSSRDPVTWIGSSTPGEISRAAPGLGMGLGLDPSVEAFGARRITAQFPGGTQTLSNIGTHTGYYKFHDENHQVPSESLYNFAKIAAGDSANVIPEFARPDHEGLNAWQRNIGSLPSDPAHLRPPIYDPHEGPPIGYEHLVDEYRNPDPVPDRATLPEDHQPVNDCGPQALRHAQELTGNENIRVPNDPDIAHSGMSARELEDAAGARMQRMETPGVLADHLTRLGEGATAIVVHEFHGPADANGIGAHAYTITNEGGRLLVHDPAIEGGPHRFPPDTTNVRSTYAIVYDSHGNPVHPVESAAPVRPGATHPEVRIGQPDPHSTRPGHQPDPNQSRSAPDEHGRRPTEPELTPHEQAAKDACDRLPQAERDALNDYAGDAYAEINRHLRFGDDLHTVSRETIDLIRSGLNQLPDHVGLVKRSITLSPEEMKKFWYDNPRGRVLPDPGFVSTSKTKFKWNPNVELTIVSATGKDISFLRPPGKRGEAEVLIPDGREFRVLDRNMGKDGILRLRWEEITEDSPPTHAEDSAPNSAPHDLEPDERFPEERVADHDKGFSLDIEDSASPKVHDDGAAPTPSHVEDPDSRPAYSPPEDQQSGPGRDTEPLQDHPDVTAPARDHSGVVDLNEHFGKIRKQTEEIFAAYHDQDRRAELPELRSEFARLLDDVGLLDNATAVTPWRMLQAHDPELAHYFENNARFLLPDPSDTTPARPHDQRSEHAPQHQRTNEPHSRDPEHRPNQDVSQPDPTHLPSDHTPPADPLGHYAERTPAGLSIHDDPTTRELARRVPEDPRYFTIDAHLTEDGHIVIDGRKYTMEEFATRLPELGYDGGRPIRFIGCDAATNGAAPRLAHALNRDVLAPTKSAWTDTDGRVYASTAETHPGGTRRPRIPPDGEWEIHHPNGTKTKASEDGFVPGTHEQDKHGVTGDGAGERAARPGEQERPSHQNIEWREPEHTQTKKVVVEPGEPFFDHNRPVNQNPSLEPRTRYEITDSEGRRTTVYTDGSNPPRITHIDALTDNTRTGYVEKPVANPDASYPLPDVNYRIDTGHPDPFTHKTDEAGRPVYDIDRFGHPDGPEYRPGGAKYREIHDWDPDVKAFTSRTDLESDCRYEVFNRDGGGPPKHHGTFYTSPERAAGDKSQFTHVNTWTDHNPELGNRRTMRPFDARAHGEVPDGLPLANTRFQVGDRLFHTDDVGNASTSFKPDYVSPHPGRDGDVQGQVGRGGSVDYSSEVYRGGHTQDHKSGSVNEAIGLISQLYRENNILKTSTDPKSLHNDSWRRSEMDRRNAYDAGIEIERVRVFASLPSIGLTPDHVYWMEQRVDPDTGQPVLHFRSHINI